MLARHKGYRKDDLCYRSSSLKSGVASQRNINPPGMYVDNK